MLVKLLVPQLRDHYAFWRQVDVKGRGGSLLGGGDKLDQPNSFFLGGEVKEVGGESKGFIFTTFLELVVKPPI